MKIVLSFILMAFCHLVSAQQIKPTTTSPVEAGRKEHPDVFSPNELDEAPKFPGGVSAWEKYISDHLKYPESAKEDGLQGRVFASVVVDKDGRLSDIKIIRALSPDCSAEAIRLIKASPKWISGKKDGKAVRASYNLSVPFKL